MPSPQELFVYALGLTLGSALIVGVARMGAAQERLNAIVKKGTERLRADYPRLKDLAYMMNKRNEWGKLGYNHIDQEVREACLQNDVDPVGLLLLSRKLQEGNTLENHLGTANYGGRVLPEIVVGSKGNVLPDNPYGLYIRLLGGLPFAAPELMPNGQSATTHRALAALGREQLMQLTKVYDAMSYTEAEAILHGTSPKMANADFMTRKGVVAVVVKEYGAARL